MKAFEARGGVAVAQLDHAERAVVARIVADVGLLLGGEVFGMEAERAPEPLDFGVEGFFESLEASLREPDDPAILRLLPNAAPTDREVADEFRRFTEAELRASKVARLRRIWEQLSEDGPDWEVAADDALPTAAALTDVRLVLAARLDLATDDDATRLHSELAFASEALARGMGADAGVEPERVWLGMLYQALTWLQDSLVTFVMDREDDAHE